LLSAKLLGLEQIDSDEDGIGDACEEEGE